MGDDTLLVVDEASGVDDATIAAVMDAPMGWTPFVAPPIERVLALRDAAVEMLKAGTHEDECLYNERGACILHLREHRLRQARLARVLGYGEHCTFCRGSKLVTSLPGMEAWPEWLGWLKDAAIEDRRELASVRALVCPVCSGS